MSYKIIEKKVYCCTCEKCEHTWESFSLPKACAGCKQIGWNKKKKDSK
jgi:hypothetical protein